MTQPASSSDAHAKLKRGDVERIARRVAQAALAEPGTSHDFALRLKLPHDAVWKRCSELVQGGVLVRVGKARNLDSGRWAAVLGPTEDTLGYAKGYFDMNEPKSKVRRERIERVLRLANDIASIRETRDGFVLVPMDKMVELGTALGRERDARLEALR